MVVVANLLMLQLRWFKAWHFQIRVHTVLTVDVFYFFISVSTLGERFAVTYALV